MDGGQHLHPTSIITVARQHCQSAIDASTWKAILWWPSRWMCNQITAISPPCRATKRHLMDCMLGLGWEGSVLWCLLTKHLFTVSLGLPLPNTFLTFQWLHSIQKSAKRDLRYLFSSQPRGRYTMIPWELPGIWWREGGEWQCLYCLVSIGSQCRISLSVLANNCLPWQKQHSDRALNMEYRNQTPSRRRDALRDCSLDKTPDPHVL